MVKRLFSINNFLIILIFLCVGLTIAVAQETDTEIHIKIEKDINGEKQIIDKIFTDPNDLELQELLKDNDVHINGEEIDVDIEIDGDKEKNSFNIQLDTDDAESVEQFKQQMKQLAKDLDIDININENDQKEMRIFKFMPDDGDFDVDNLFDNLDENVKEWLDMEQLKENLNHKLKDWDLDVNSLYDSKKPMMGVTIKDLEDGILIENVSDNMGAKEAGLETNDIIKTIDGEKMESVDEVIDYIAQKEAGDFIEVQYERDGKLKKANVELKGYDRFIKHEWKLNDEELKKFKFNGEDFDLNHMDKWIEEKVENINGEKTSTRVMVMITDLDDEDVKTLKDISPNAQLLKIDANEIDELEFFPNPSKGLFNLKFDVEQPADTQINIYDINGKEIYTETINNFEGTFDEDINISQSEGGTYILEILKDNKRFNKKIIIE